MDLKKAYSALKHAQSAKSEWTREILRLRNLIERLGGDPDEKKTMLAFRNEEIYDLSLQKIPYKQIASTMHLSVSRITEIVHREQLKAKSLWRELISTDLPPL